MRIFSTALLALMVAFQANADTSPNKSNTVTVSGALEFSNVDPSSSGYIFTKLQVIETLFDVDSSGNLLPGLALEATPNKDLTQWTITLRDGVHFQDGSLMDAYAVVNSLNIALSKYGSLGKVPVISIQAQGKHQVVVELSEAYKSLPAVLANYSNVILSRAAYDEDGNVVSLIGTGPFQLFELAPPHKATVKKFDGYWGKKAHIEYVTYLTGHRGESRVLQATSGQADIALQLPPASIMRLKMNPQTDVHSYSLPRTLVLKLNNAHPFMNSVEARQALSLAIDRKGIASAVLGTPSSATAQLLPSSMGDWYLESFANPQSDVQKAKAMLKELGWSENSQGMFERDGKLFELTLITYADRPELTNVATALQAQWKKLGVKLNVNITNSSSIPAGHQDGSLEVALMARNYGVIVDPLVVLSNDFSEQGGDWGAMNWSNQEFNQLIKQLNQTLDAADYREKAQRAATILATELPVIPVSAYTEEVSVNKRLKGFRFDPFGRNFYLSDLEF
ncbi:ABC transporter substrate-binding protein [Vibrio ziniensis]|uniref:ABC transporter substrate-binding protein n=1 Tax=Vibrio ziniensis TaxID=2711221 RepID=A0A6G7CNR9_9VIBR|nr:ABC transporter substrate-binding protein [Vibrio ziniensis]QIH43724.1 ABC transporter substrate-binding protein [Vibrio ziniensis]